LAARKVEVLLQLTLYIINQILDFIDSPLQLLKPIFLPLKQQQKCNPLYVEALFLENQFSLINKFLLQN